MSRRKFSHEFEILLKLFTQNSFDAGQNETFSLFGGLKKDAFSA